MNLACLVLALIAVCTSVWAWRAQGEIRRLRQARPVVQPGLTSELLANVSHELRTPLTSITGYVELLEQRVSDPQSRALLEKVARNGGVLLGMIDRMLDLSRLNAGRLEMTVLPVPLDECVEAAYHSVEPQLQAKGLAFRLALPPQTVMVKGSFERLQQVFTNLLGNAVKFTQEGEVAVSIGVVDGMAEVRVSDTGIGIAAEHLEPIFEAFAQADHTVRRRFGGSGLGLAISRKLVELHQGTLRVESTPGRGSTFIVRLPGA